MRFVRLCVCLGLTLLLACFWLARAKRPSPPNDLFAGFLGVTNNPGGSVYPWLSVLGDGRGLYALFGVTNIDQSHYVRFGISAIETHGNEGWRADRSWRFEQELGSVWAPGHSCVYAVPWPDGLATDTPWRLRMWVMREPKLVFVALNQRLGRELFRPHGRHSITSDVVAPITVQLGEQPSVENAQPDDTANRSQPGRSETNRAPAAAGPDH